MSAERQKQKTAIERTDEELLASLGYKQEFKRAFTGLEVSALCWINGVLRWYTASLELDWCTGSGIPQRAPTDAYLCYQTFGIAFSIIGLLPSIA